MFRFISYLIVCGLTSILVWPAASFAQPAPAAAAPAIQAPPAGAAEKSEVVGFQDSKGNTFFLHDFKGKIVIINLWASWCAPCIQEMPSLGKLQQAYKDKGVVVLALSEDDTIAQAVNFFKNHPESGLAPLLDKNHGVWLALQSRGLPTTMIVDKHGNAYKRIEGPVNWQSPAIAQILATLTSQP